VLFASNSITLYTLDTTDGSISSTVGSIGFGSGFNNGVNSLAFDSATNTLYGVDTVRGSLLTISTTTGAGTLVGTSGSVGFDNIAGLAFSGGRLLGSDAMTDQLVEINTTTGVGTAIGPIGFDNVLGLSAIPEPSAFVFLGIACVAWGLQRQRLRLSC